MSFGERSLGRARKPFLRATRTPGHLNTVYRLCCFARSGQIGYGLWLGEQLLDLAQCHLADRLPLHAEQPVVALCDADEDLAAALQQLAEQPARHALVDRSSIHLLPPIPRPPKLLLLAGNYPEHVQEQGDVVAERRETFPYVFMKPPSTTLVGDGSLVTIPVNSPQRIDYELELALIIGRRGREIAASDALQYVAGYTIINDLSDRGFRPHPHRRERPRDKFFDWLHGKWHDGFCPCGPCVVPARFIPDPQKLPLQLTVNGQLRQRATTGQMVFGVAEIIEFISQFVTLEPGDLISTGTPAGVGNATGQFLKPGDQIIGEIEPIGQLTVTMG
jgi:2-keto-4-pentenoate hydratase/2-oxohepta-3-ene-1,7-dioic acid hydratase in catechol pathway